MSKPKPDPKLCFHKSKNLYFVRLSGRTFYLGTDRKAAERGRLLLLLDWKSSEGAFADRPAQEEITLDEVFARWLTAFAKAHYQNNPSHLESIKANVAHFLKFYGSLPAIQFGPRTLKAYRAGLCNGSTTLSTINGKIRLLRRIVRWAASEELIPVAVSQALDTVEGLRSGRVIGVKEGKIVRPVAWEHVEATLPYMPRPVADLMRLLWHCGARVGELVGLRASDINQSGDVWSVNLDRHKTAYKGRSRTIYFGAECQAVLRPVMLRTLKDRPLFSPWDSIAERAAAASGHRRPDQQRTPRETDRTVGEVYDVRAVNRAVTRAIASANADPARADMPKIPHWHVHQIRHSFATRARTELGLQAASAALGHADLQTTQIYAELETGLALSVAEKMG